MKRFSLLLVVYACLLGCSEPSLKKVVELDGGLSLVSKQLEFTSGTPIQLSFEEEKRKNLLLVVQNGWGTTVLYPDMDSKQMVFTLPNFMTKKAGWVDWQLKYLENEVSTGAFLITPNPVKGKDMEVYVGPTDIFADGKDHTMMVALPQDKYGNPMPDGSQVITTLKTKGRFSTDTLRSENMYAFKYITAGKSKDTYFIGAHYGDQASKEFTVGVLPTHATDFSIEVNRVHSFADGNQIVSFTTTPIKDGNSNIVADGTLVNFLVKDDSDNYLKTIGQTINGVATGKLLHPEKPSHWIVKANVSGSANSNILEVNFEEAVSDFSIQLSKDGQQLSIGPIQGYMQQLVPDGSLITVEIQNQEGTTIHEIETTSRKGRALLDLPDFFDEKLHNMLVAVGGTTKQIGKESK
ncbi:hypothetical protein [Flagellimonas nanhaiensis]|uniref:Uncharacterized protein n=1 Tax=Flagellimonas nanhaiensis TaxID=2292706 RepID=A0A371JMR7_9FLAO|nr:hypothetical protein [Allomuricauda nanhaiensis]RDY58433.1 hypothetical protein DX873_15645 [Allomuricauda nanhaiensis]